LVRHGESVWRVLGSGPDLLESLPRGSRIGRVHWESEFCIANRIAGRFSKGPVFLAGDAAHVHAGIGARGMNLGIEDAWVFAELFHQGRLRRYDAVRRPVVRRVVGQITRMMSVPRAETLPGRIVRAMPWLVTAAAPVLRSRVQPWLLGLDHEVRL
jgi:3-(3-hydroxy-phenyl)propionate hydroxylase